MKKVIPKTEADIPLFACISRSTQFIDEGKQSSPDRQKTEQLINFVARATFFDYQAE